jgi:hypothetical protein
MLSSVSQVTICDCNKVPVPKKKNPGRTHLQRSQLDVDISIWYIRLASGKIRTQHLFVYFFFLMIVFIVVYL